MRAPGTMKLSCSFGLPQIVVAFVGHGTRPEFGSGADQCKSAGCGLAPEALQKR
jgi:hypothetical protein